jgi:hypothetical protein
MGVELGPWNSKATEKDLLCVTDTKLLLSILENSEHGVLESNKKRVTKKANEQFVVCDNHCLYTSLAGGRCVCRLQGGLFLQFAVHRDSRPTFGVAVA